MSNRQQRRNKKHRNIGRLPGESLADAMQRNKKTMEAYATAARDETLDMKAEIRVQRALWMCCLAMHRAFGIGPSRFQQFSGELDKVVAWYEDNKKKGRGDDVYANEMLRREASKCAGLEVNSLYDEEMMEAVGELNRARTVADQVRAMGDIELAFLMYMFRTAAEQHDKLDELTLLSFHPDLVKASQEELEKISRTLLWLRGPAGQEVALGT